MSMRDRLIDEAVDALKNADLFERAVNSQLKHAELIAMISGLSDECLLTMTLLSNTIVVVSA